MKFTHPRAKVGNVRSGQRVGKYVLGEQIARGGMAEVWAARVEGPGGFVKSLALKFILDSFAGDADLERLFVNEARVAAHLQHANLVSVFDFDTWTDAESGQAGRYYIAMERVDGNDLRRVLQVARHREHEFSPSLALYIAGEVLKGLRYVHERREDSGARPLGLVHRDVSPHNVLIGMSGEVKLSDFGIAKAMSQSLGTQTQAGTIRGKLAYGSPEQLRGEPVDHRADQFALGITLWEMLAQRRLFDGADEMEIVGKVLRCEIPPLPAAASIDPAVEMVVRRMLAGAVQDRFPSTAEALSAVLTAPGYTADATPLVDLMRALFAPRPMALPPTVPLKLSDPRPPGGLAETSALDKNPLDDDSTSGQTGTTGGTGATGATASGYVSADSPSLPSWIDDPVAYQQRWRPRWWMIAAVIGVGVAVGMAVVRRPSSSSSSSSVTPASFKPATARPRATESVRSAAKRTPLVPSPSAPAATPAPPTQQVVAEPAPTEGAATTDGDGRPPISDKRRRRKTSADGKRSPDEAAAPSPAAVTVGPVRNPPPGASGKEGAVPNDAPILE